MLGLLLATSGCWPSGAQRAARLAGFGQEATTGTPPGMAALDGREWHLALFHVHTREGGYEFKDPTGLDQAANYDGPHARYALRVAATYGIRAVFLTDHNSILSAFDKDLQSSARSVGVTLIPGTEWSLGGPLAINLPITPGHAGPHVAVVGYRAASARDVLAPRDTRIKATTNDLNALVDEAHARGGAAILCHPDALNADYPLPPADFDLVEVDGPLIENPAAARARWQEWLMAGRRIGAISSANWRVAQLPGSPMHHLNLVRAPSRAPDVLTDALRGGHLMVVTSPNKLPRVLLGADADGDGSFDDVREGDVLIPGPGVTRVRFQVRVLGARGRALVLYGAGSREPMHRETLEGDEEVRAYSVALQPDRRTFVRAELWQDTRMLVLTNPLYFDPPPRAAPDGGATGTAPDGTTNGGDLIRIITVDAGPVPLEGETP